MCCNHMHWVATECHLCTIPLRTRMLQPAARCRAALRLAASDPIQASEAKAPLAESRGVCAAPWTSNRLRRKRGRAFDCPECSRRTGSRDSIDVRAAGFGSEQSRRTSALRLCLGLRVGQRTRAKHGPTVLRWLPRGDGESRSVSRGEPCLLLGRAARATGAGARPLCRGPAGFGGASAAGHGARQAARRARKTAVRRAASLGRRLLRGSTEYVSDEAREYRLASKREWS